MSQNPSPVAPIATIFIIIHLIVIPLVFTSVTIDPVLPLRYLLLCAVLSLASAVIIIRRAVLPDWPLVFLRHPLWLVYGLFLLISAISLFQSVNLAEGAVELLRLIILAGLVPLYLYFLNSYDKTVDIICKCLAVLTLILTTMGLFQYFDMFFQEIPGHFYIYGTMVNKNLLASALTFCLPFLLFGIFHFDGAWGTTTLAAFCLAVLTIILAQTRSAMLTCVIVLVGLAVLLAARRKSFNFPKKIRQFYRLRLIFTVQILIIALIFGLAIHFLSKENNPQKAKYITGSYENLSSANERLQLWERTLSLVADHPLGGVGLNNWKLVFPRYGMGGMRSAEGSTYFIRPHNEFLAIASETGLPGLLVFLLLLALAAFTALRTFLHAQVPRTKILLVLMLAGLLLFSGISFFSFPRERIFHSSIFALMLAIIIHYDLHTLPPVKTSAKIALLLSGILLLTQLSGFGVALVRFNAEIAVKEARHLGQQKNWAAQTATISRAETPFYPLDPAATPIKLIKAEGLFQQSRFEEALQGLLISEKSNPHHLLLLSNIAAAYNRLNNSTEAENYFLKALAVSPESEQVLLNLTAVYFQRGDYQKAYEFVQRCNQNSHNPRVQRYRRAIEKRLPKQPQQ